MADKESIGKIEIKVAGLTLYGWLNNSESARKIHEALPLTGKVMTWGEEIYFSIPLSLPLSEDARAEVEVGEIGYWPPGRAICIFFGLTPASEGEQIKAASPVNIIGYIEGDLKQLKKVKEGDTIELFRVD